MAERGIGRKKSRKETLSEAQHKGKPKINIEAFAEEKKKKNLPANQLTQGVIQRI